MIYDMKAIRVIPIIAFALAAASCGDIFEEEIQHERIRVVAPIEGMAVPEGEVVFLWREMEGATSYRITIVSPGFWNARTVLADVLLTPTERTDGDGGDGGDVDPGFEDGEGDDSDNETVMLPAPTIYRHTLPPGLYQWSVRGINSAYVSKEWAQTLIVIDVPEPEPEPEPEPGEPGGPEDPTDPEDPEDPTGPSDQSDPENPEDPDGTVTTKQAR